jgi:hypothetical protein
MNMELPPLVAHKDYLVSSLAPYLTMRQLYKPYIWRSPTPRPITIAALPSIESKISNTQNSLPLVPNAEHATFEKLLPESLRIGSPVIIKNSRNLMNIYSNSNSKRKSWGHDSDRKQKRIVRFVDGIASHEPLWRSKGYTNHIRRVTGPESYLLYFKNTDKSSDGKGASLLGL